MRSGSRRRTAGPGPITSFVGREAELQAVRGLLEQRRLVTIVGPPGIGKTRLAVELARSVEAEGGSVVLCDLAHATRREEVRAAVGRAVEIELTGGGGDPDAADLAVALADHGALLLVLDNFEQVVDEA